MTPNEREGEKDMYVVQDEATSPTPRCLGPKEETGAEEKAIANTDFKTSH